MTGLTVQWCFVINISHRIDTHIEDYININAT